MYICSPPEAYVHNTRFDSIGSYYDYSYLCFEIYIYNTHVYIYIYIYIYMFNSLLNSLLHSLQLPGVRSGLSKVRTKVVKFCLRLATANNGIPWHTVFFILRRLEKSLTIWCLFGFQTEISVSGRVYWSWPLMTSRPDVERRVGIDTSKVAVKSAPTPNDLSFVDFRNRSESIFLDPGRLYIYIDIL